MWVASEGHVVILTPAAESSDFVCKYIFLIKYQFQQKLLQHDATL